MMKISIVVMRKGEKMSELKPCPFCGAMPQGGFEFYEREGVEVKLAATVECTGCGTRKRKIFNATLYGMLIPFSDYEKAFNHVVKEWNRRA